MYRPLTDEGTHSKAVNVVMLWLRLVTAHAALRVASRPNCGRTWGSAKARGGCAHTLRPQRSDASPSKLCSELGVTLSVAASQSSTTSFASLRRAPAALRQARAPPGSGVGRVRGTLNGASQAGLRA
jgi:hypothetical protein